MFQENGPWNFLMSCLEEQSISYCYWGCVSTLPTSFFVLSSTYIQKNREPVMGFHGYNFSLRNEATLTEDLKELPGYKSKAFPCDKGRVNTLPTTSFVLSGIMVQLLLEKQGYLAKRRKNHHLRDAERWYIQVLRWQRWFDCSIDSDTCHAEKCREWSINFLADPMFWGGYGIGLQVIVLEGFLEKSISSFCSVFKA